MTSRHAGSEHEPEPEAQVSGVAPGEGGPSPMASKVRPGPSFWRWAAFAGGILIALALMGIVLRSCDPGGTKPQPASPTPTATKPAGQLTLLIQVRNDVDIGSNNLIAGIHGGMAPAQVLVPSRLMVDVTGAGQQTLGQSAKSLNRSASQDALSDLLALRIDGTLSLGRLALAGMVDYVGGITLNVRQEITEERPETGQRRVVVPKGKVRLNGSQAAAYALTWLPDEPESERLRRYSEVMTETIRSLPTDQLRIEAMLTSLGGQARTTTTTSDVAAYLITMGKEIRKGAQRIRVLPTSDTTAEEALSTVRVDLSAADAMLAEVLPEARLDDSEIRPRVLVQNGTGLAGLSAPVRDKLNSAGMLYINGGNAPELGYLHTRVIVADNSAASLQIGAEIAQALGVASSSVEISKSEQQTAAALVILGRDFLNKSP